MNDLDQLRRRLGVERLRILGGINQMSADVILDTSTSRILIAPRHPAI